MKNNSKEAQAGNPPHANGVFVFSSTEPASSKSEASYTKRIAHLRHERDDARREAASAARNLERSKNIQEEKRGDGEEKEGKNCNGDEGPSPHNADTIVLQNGKFKVSLALDMQYVIFIKVINLNSGDSYERIISEDELPNVIPQGLPKICSEPEGFYKFLVKSFRQEATNETQSCFQCKSFENESNEFEIFSIFTMTSDFGSHSTEVHLTIPLKAKSDDRTRLQLGLDSLRDEMMTHLHGEMAKQRVEYETRLVQQREEYNAQRVQICERMDLMTLQMNDRVSFGVNLSVSLKCKKLVMLSKMSLHYLHVHNTGPYKKTASDCYADFPAHRHVQQCLTSAQKIKASPWCTFLIQPHIQKPPNVAVNPTERNRQVLALSEGRFMFHNEDTDTIMPLSSSALKPVKLLRELEEIFLWGYQLDSIEFLAGLPKLKTVVLVGTSVTNIDAVATLPSLQTFFFFGNTKGNNVNLAPLAKVKTLKTVNFRGSTNVRDLTPIAHIDTIVAPVDNFGKK